MIKKLQAKGNSGKEESFQRVMFGTAESHEIEDFFLRKVQENVHDFECLWTVDERNDRGTSISHNNSLTNRRDHDSRSDAGNKPVERHGSSFQDQLQILESEGTVSECSQVVVNINSSTSGLPPQRTCSVRKGNSHKHESGVIHPSELAPDQEAHKKNTYSCNECNITFLQDSELTRHQRIHTGRKAYKCNICCQAFNDKSTLIVHQRNHTGEKPYKCDVCGHCFKQHTHLQYHRRVHTGEKPYKCDVCGKALVEKQGIQFIRPFILERNHIRVKYVPVALLESHTLEFIGEFIPERNHINVMCVARPLA